MRKSRFTEEQIIAILGEQEHGVVTAEVCRVHGISQGTCYKWKAKLRGMDISDARKLKTLETENGRLRDELLNEEVFQSLADARRKLARWRYDYNNIRPHSAHNGQPPATARQEYEQELELCAGSASSALAETKIMRYTATGFTKGCMSGRMTFLNLIDCSLF